MEGSNIPEVPDASKDSALATTFEGPKTELSLRAIPTKLLKFCYPPCLRKRAVSDPGPIEVQTSIVVSTKPSNHCNSGYQSFPPPTFQHSGQPRALDSRLYPEILDPSRAASSFPKSSQTQDSHGQRVTEGLAFPNLTCPHTSTKIPIPLIPPHLSASLSRRPIHHISSHSSLPKANSLSLRGGKLKPLADNERIPASLWYLSGQRGKPPTAAEFREWRAKNKEKVKALEKQKAEGKKKEKKKEDGGKRGWFGGFGKGKGKSKTDTDARSMRSGAAETEITSW